MTTTILLPVSRDEHLDRIFHSLEMLECKREETNLFVIVDGNANLFVRVRNFVEMSKFSQRLAVQYVSKLKKLNYDPLARRIRISDIHNQAKQHLWSSDYIFGIEDDTIISSDALKVLQRDYGLAPYAGFIQGVQLGRWGIPYVGAWKVDDIYEPNELKTILPGVGLQEIDAGGFYCFLTKFDNYINHTFKPFENNGLGPDVDFGIEMRKLGFINYINWNINTIHKGQREDVGLHNTQPRVLTMQKIQGVWRQNNSAA